MSYNNIVILTGAGISAESGLATFRDAGGLWEGHPIEEVATPEGFARNPALVHQFYNQRRAQARTVYPNAAHHAIADFASQHTGTLILITQNVDSLHKQAEAGLTMPPGYKLLHMHGELNKARCIATDTVHEWHDDMDTSTSCPCCHKPGCLRPHIVWFGEMPLSMDIIPHYVHHCDLFISIGTSGNVYPAAGFVQQVRLASQGHTVEINMEPSHGHTLFHQKIYGPATKTVPEFFNSL